jgi:REP element-mobilizing transposase RayT
MYRAMQQATLTAAKREDCRIVHFSIQNNHVHLIVEAESRTALAKGMQGFQIAAAKLLNSEFTKRTGVRRTGTVFTDRYHARALETPREVRNAIAYVLNHWRRRNEHRADVAKTWRVDPYSSALSFDGWKEIEHGRFVDVPPTYEPLVVWGPRIWLLREGWRRHGLIRFDEVPGPGEKPQYA